MNEEIHIEELKMRFNGLQVNSSHEKVKNVYIILTGYVSRNVSFGSCTAAQPSPVLRICLQSRGEVSQCSRMKDLYLC